ncbi:CYFA0S23e01706g1_1 [Cyberlindnera fabianii]|uniref:CYFA0S23e01706g1_1 n=1 Tax=Cyberlindnera fabianii TaxID=36022 RepID=A0A061B9A8_CYBFA|nr:CYFA0S23e01706g1_1 [Cyberlindnera fabianii]
MAESTTVPWNNLGSSGLKISNVIIGCMSYGSKEWADWVISDEEKVYEILNKAYELGIRTFDTADMYSNGVSEILLGKWIKKYNIKRDKIVIMTKVFNPVDEDIEDLFKKQIRGFTKAEEVEIINSRGLSRKHILDGAQESVRRLGTYIDLYQIHRFDHEVPMEETMRALNDVVEQGHARYIGASTMRAVEFVMLQNVAEKNGWHKFVSMQSKYNLLDREDEHEMNYYCQKTGVGLIPWSPLAAGMLARPVPEVLDDSNITARQKNGRGKISAQDKDKVADITIINRVEEVAKKLNVPMAAVATAWALAKGTNPIAGISSVKRLEELFVGANLKLSEEDIKYLEEPYLPKLRDIR